MHDRPPSWWLCLMSCIEWRIQHIPFLFRPGAIKTYNQPILVVVSKQACASEFKSSVFDIIHTITCHLSAFTV